MSNWVHPLMYRLFHSPLDVFAGAAIILVISLSPTEARADFVNLTGAETAPASTLNGERLRVMGVESIVFDPVGNHSDKGDYLSVMRQNVNNLQQVFK